MSTAETFEVRCSRPGGRVLLRNVTQLLLRPDMIILCGDLVNTNHDYESLSSSLRSSGTTATSGGSSDISQSFRDAADTLARMRIQQEENEFRSILQGLGGISKSVFYIPG